MKKPELHNIKLEDPILLWPTDHSAKYSGPHSGKTVYATHDGRLVVFTEICPAIVKSMGFHCRNSAVTHSDANGKSYCWTHEKWRVEEIPSEDDLDVSIDESE
jgi:hypothetical protein